MAIKTRLDRLERVAKPEQKIFVLWEDPDDPNLLTVTINGVQKTMTQDEWNSLHKGEDVIVVSFESHQDDSD